ncbi:transfer protein [Nonomuraea sp. SYSU D8015]|uniref:transfer protein n=1 Tax=Nonomuraea sp. SYSU D8015 TaxID=2593644 RepID=UPI00166081AF|nr:transfer protein [Nonomuraea sp. SYSU D8015]
MSAVAIPDGEIVELMLEAPPGQVVKYDHEALCSALGVEDDPGRVVVEVHGRRAIVTVYPANPLAVMPPPSPADMLMDRHGRIVVGRHHNGRPARRRLFDKRTGRAQRALVFGTTGAGKSRIVQYVMACEKRNGIVTWYGDLKGGQSAPEAEGNVDWFATTQEEVILMLRSAVAVASLARQPRYWKMGRNTFLIGDPDPLMSVRLDEANRALERGAPYRDEAAYLLRELSRAGGSLGVGAELDAQASHLEELGGSDTLRAMFKEGEVTLLRWTSTVMQQLAKDGLLEPGTQLMPIPKQLKQPELRSQFDAYDDDDDFCDTQGMAYLLTSLTPTSLMRHWRIGSIEPLPGLDPEILALYGPGEPARLEEASWEAAGEAYAARHDPAAMAALCQALRDEYAEKEQRTQSADGDSASRGGRKKKRLEDRVVTALAAAEDALTAEEILDVVNQDGGREVRIGSVRNTLVALANDEEIARVGHGLYALNR